jgi:hypothetical protein
MKRKDLIWNVLALAVLTASAAAAQGTGCTDSDNGNFYVRGVTDADGKSMYDVCVTTSGITPHVRMIEWYCDGGKAESMRYTCPNGCSDGACNGPMPTPDSGLPISANIGGAESQVTELTEAATSPSAEGTETGQLEVGEGRIIPTSNGETQLTGCTDSDGGLNYGVLGWTMGENGPRTDQCFNRGKVREWYCDGNLAMSQVYRCANGCLNGVCEDEPGAALNVSPNARTSPWAVNNPPARDGLQNPNTYTTGNIITAQNPEGCTDSDGGKDYYASGVASGANGQMADRCLGPNQLQEAYCDLNLVKTVKRTCEHGCYDGACYPTENTGPRAESTAVDTSIGSKVEMRESQQASASEESGESAAVEKSESTDAASRTLSAAATVGKCSETDGGKDYTTSGVTVGSNGKKDDKCRNPTVLEEWYCEGGLAKMVLHACTGGCAQGACRTA